MTGSGEHGVDGIAIQFAFARGALQLLRGLVGRERSAMRARFDLGLIHLGCGEDAHGGREHGCRHVAVIAAAIQPLVMRRGDRAPIRQRRTRREDALGESWVKYGCSRTCSSSVSFNAPGLFQMPNDTPTEPMSCT
jgi:hypothetical protein